MVRVVVFALLFGLAASSGRAQVRASQPDAEEIRAMTGQAEELCPLLLEISLAKREGKRSIVELGTPGSWVENRGLRSFACDKAQIVSVSLSKERERKGRVLLVASPRLTTEWVRQDVNLTIQLVATGEVRLSEKWEDLTIGSDESTAARMGAVWSSSSKSPRAEWWVESEDLAAWFAEGADPTLRILLEVPE